MNEECVKVDRSSSKLIFKLEYRRVIKGYLYERENCRNVKKRRFLGSVLELQMCPVA